MPSETSLETISRREFFRKLALGAALIGLRKAPLMGLTNPNPGPQESKLFYKYRHLSVNHFPELERDIDELKQAGKLSDNPVYRSYIDNKHYAIPKDFPNAKFLIIVAVYTPLAYVKFHYDNKVYDIPIPPQYWDDGTTAEMVEDEIRKSIVRDKKYRVQRARGMLLKRLGVRSGLSRYGRNNISYVDGMGSFLTLLAYFTDFEFPQDHFQDVQMMKSCRDCRICRTQCPNQCIRDDNFVINAGRCVTLYNEVEGEFPDWMPRDAHNALMGCLKCQRYCPANREVMQKAIRLADVSEAATRQFLLSEPGNEICAVIAEKAKIPSLSESADSHAVFKRNLGVLIP